MSWWRHELWLAGQCHWFNDWDFFWVVWHAVWWLTILFIAQNVIAYLLVHDLMTMMARVLLIASLLLIFLDQIAWNSICLANHALNLKRAKPRVLPRAHNLIENPSHARALESFLQSLSLMCSLGSKDFHFCCMKSERKGPFEHIQWKKLHATCTKIFRTQSIRKFRMRQTQTKIKLLTSFHSCNDFFISVNWTSHFLLIDTSTVHTMINSCSAHDHSENTS